MHSQESGPTSQGGSKPDPPSLFPWRLQWGLSVFQWGFNPTTPPPANFYPGCSGNKIYVVPKITNKSVTLAELLDVKNRIKQTGLQMIRK